MISTHPGSHPGHISLGDWSRLLAVALIWGSSFLWIAVALDSFEPGVIALSRVALGAMSLFVLRASRIRIAKEDWVAVAVVGIAGNAAPALLFALAEQTVSSSVVGMLNAGVGIVTLSVAFAMGNRSFARRHVLGLLIGLGGVAMLVRPTLQGSNAAATGVGYVILALIGYGLTNNVLPPLQQKYGGIAVIARAQLVGTIVLLPFGIADLSDSRFGWGSLIAVVILGVFGTGVARSMYATIIGRIGAPRASVVAYLIPLVAIALGVTVRNESVQFVQFVGLGLVLASALLTSSRLKPAR